MRRCSRCGLEKEATEFNSVTSGYCRLCFRIYRRERYVPVAQATEERREKDAAWRAKHDAKICAVCKKAGSPRTIFRHLSHKRCSDCMKKGLWHCPTHGVIRKARCQKCRYRQIKVRNAHKAVRARQAAKENIVLMKDGCCVKCGKRLRDRGALTIGHRCGQE